MIASEPRTPTERLPLPPDLQEELLSLMPNLRAFAISLCRNADRADDLVQETMLRAIGHIESFEPGTNLAAWLATILRNCFLSDARKRCNEVEDVEGTYVGGLRSPPEQGSRIELQEIRAALAQLPFEQREALLLVGTAGLSYEDTAVILQTTIGTIKSRINRARTRLAALLSIDVGTELGWDNCTRAVLIANRGVRSTQWL